MVRLLGVSTFAVLISPDWLNADHLPEQAGVIRLFDQTGRLVMQERLSFGITELNTGHLPPGMYFYSISVREEPVKAGKVVKVRGD